MTKPMVPYNHVHNEQQRTPFAPIGPICKTLIFRAERSAEFVRWTRFREDNLGRYLWGDQHWKGYRRRELDWLISQHPDAVRKEPVVIDYINHHLKKRTRPKLLFANEWKYLITKIKKTPA